jgi:cell division transport system permease protein
VSRPAPGSAVPPAQVVPRAAGTAALTWVAAGAMAFVAVFALALGLAAGRLADRWEATLADTATLRLSAPPAQIAAQTEAALEILRTTPGVASARVIDLDESRALLEPWFGPDLPVEVLALPRLIEIVAAPEGYDPLGLRLRLAGEAPGAVLDDHARWRAPLVQAAGVLRGIALGSVVLIGAAMAAMVALAAGFALAANAQTIRVLRLVGARDAFIVRAFTRRFALRALGGAALGAVAGMAALAFVPQDAGGVMAGVAPRGLDWLAMAALPPAAALVAWITTRIAAFRVLRRDG